MKRIFINVTLASVVTLVAYIVLSAVWGAILSEVESAKLRLFIISAMTSTAYAFFLLYFSKIRKAVGENEVVADHKDDPYTSLINDLKMILKNEKKILIAVGVIIGICFVLNKFDNVVFGKKTISFPTIVYAPMTIFGTFFDVDLFGYIVSYIFIGVCYVLMLLLYRKKKYLYLTKKH